MGAMADASAHAEVSKGHPAKTPAESSCKVGIACQAVVATAVLPSPSELAPPIAAIIAMSDPLQTLVASHPPDRTLRPPIRL